MSGAHVFEFMEEIDDMWKSTMMIVLCGGCWVLAGGAANGQTTRPFDAASRQAVRPYFSPPYSKAPVSPYVNLGFNASGLSNYQTLVRPLVEEREALARQSAALERLNQRLPGAPAGGFQHDAEGTSQPPQPRSAVRFMHYSHYFGTIR